MQLIFFLVIRLDEIMEVKHLLYCSNYMSLTHSAILVINKLRVFFMNYVNMNGHTF